MEKMKELTEEIKASHQSLELFTKYKQPIDSPYFEPPIKRNETVLDKSFLYVLNEINSKNYHLHIGYEYTVLSNAEWIDEVMENKYTSFLKAMRKRLIDILTLQGDIELKIDMEAFGNKEEDNAMSKERAREILGVAEGASNREIRKAFKRKALKKHPDKGGTKEEFVELRQALDTLVPNLRVVSLKF
jgi:glycerol-3-phosphate cytidylyltransferase-like family protein